jgi:hypothetical protein
MFVGRQHGDRDIRDVVAGDGGDAAIVCRSADHAVLAGEERDVVEVHARAQECVREARRTNALLRVEVVSRERERRVGGGGQERRVDDALDAGLDGCVDGRGVLLDAVDLLASRDEEERADPAQPVAHRGPVAVGGH